MIQITGHSDIDIIILEGEFLFLIWKNGYTMRIFDFVSRGHIPNLMKKQSFVAVMDLQHVPVLVL